MNDELLDLASAYLDGTATTAERAQVEADPELVSLVARLREISAAVRDAPPPDDAIREQAIGAALSVADAPDHGRTDALGATVVALRRPRSARVLSYAAALLAVGVLGAVVVAGVRGGGSDDAAVSGDAPAAELFDTSDDTGDDTDGVAEAFAFDAPTEDEQRTADDSNPDSNADSDADDGTADAPAEETPELSAVLDLAGLTDRDLAELVRGFVDDDMIDTTPERVCATVLDGVVVDPDVFTVSDGIPVVVGLWADRARVVDPSDCTVLTEVSLGRAGD